MTLIDQLLVALLIAVFSGLFGKYLGGKRKVAEDLCCERRESCFNMVLEKIGELTKCVDRLEKTINSKLLGL